MGNTFGRLFRVTTWGESHGPATGVVIDGCPPGLRLDLDLIRRDLARRRPGQSPLTSGRKEPDEVRVLSGLERGRTLGTPLHLLIENVDARPADYAGLADVFRPSHADWTWETRFGRRASSGGGRASARETAARVAAGAVARQILAGRARVDIVAWVDAVKSVEARVDPRRVTLAAVESTAVRCPDPAAARRMEGLIRRARAQGDTVGGVVALVARNVPAGLGSPVFDKMEADLARALMSLPASRGFEIGSGFAGTRLPGSEHNDAFRVRGGRIRTATNRSGGIQGGITNGEDVLLRVAFKPPATLGRPTTAVDRRGRRCRIEPGGRHDPCVLPRAVVIVEAMTALVLVDHILERETLLR